MATKLYLRDGNTSGATTSADAMHDLLSTAGAGTVNYVKNSATGTVTPPTSATQWTKTGAGTICTWASKALTGVTISGTVTFNLWAFESAAQANATITAELYRLDNAGAIQSTIASATLARTELGTSSALQNWNPSVTSRTLSNGDRLGVRVFMDDGAAVTMASGRTMTMVTDGASGGASGDSWVQVAETLLSYYSAAQSETVSITESTTSKFVSKATGQSEAVSVAESVIGLRGLPHVTNSETVTIAESDAVLFRAIKALSEAVSITESKTQLFASKATGQAESLILAEADADTFRAKATSQAETVSIAESRTSHFAATKAQSETVTESESLAAHVPYVIAQPESASLAESSSTARASTVAQPDTLTLSESRSSAFSVSVTQPESVTITESRAASYAAMAPVSESGSLGGTVAVAGSGQYAEGVNEAVSASDSTTTLARYTASLSDDVSVLDSLAVGAELVLAESDSVSVSESVYGGLVGNAYHETLSETVHVTGWMVELYGDLAWEAYCDDAKLTLVTVEHHALAIAKSRTTKIDGE